MGASGLTEQQLQEERAALIETFHRLEAQKKDLVDQGKLSGGIDYHAAVEINQKIADYDRRRYSFNKDPQRLKFSIEELPQIRLIPFKDYINSETETIEEANEKKERIEEAGDTTTTAKERETRSEGRKTHTKGQQPIRK